MSVEETYQKCKDMFKGTNIKVVVPHQHPRPYSYCAPRWTPPGGILFVDYISLLTGPNHGHH